jgi:hypothetical protein
VQLLCLPHASTALRAPNAAAGKTSSSSSSYGSCRLHGTVEALAYVHKRDPVGKALQDLKNDVINSLSARLQLLEEDAAAAAADDAKQPAAAGEADVAAHPLLLAAGAGKRCRVGLARRVLLPWSSLGLKVGAVCMFVCCLRHLEDRNPTGWSRTLLSLKIDKLICRELKASM